VNQRGLFRRRETADVFPRRQDPSPQRWAGGHAGQHVELGIAEHNLFLTLAAFGLSRRCSASGCCDRHGL